MDDEEDYEEITIQSFTMSENKLRMDYQKELAKKYSQVKQVDQTLEILDVEFMKASISSQKERRSIDLLIHNPFEDLDRRFYMNFSQSNIDPSHKNAKIPSLTKKVSQSCRLCIDTMDLVWEENQSLFEKVFESELNFQENSKQAIVFLKQGILWASEKEGMKFMANELTIDSKPILVAFNKLLPKFKEQRFGHNPDLLMMNNHLVYENEILAQSDEKHMYLLDFRSSLKQFKWEAPVEVHVDKKANVKIPVFYRDLIKERNTIGFQLDGRYIYLVSHYLNSTVSKINVETGRVEDVCSFLYKEFQPVTFSVFKHHILIVLCLTVEISGNYSTKKDKMIIVLIRKSNLKFLNDCYFSPDFSKSPNQKMKRIKIKDPNREKKMMEEYELMMKDINYIPNLPRNRIHKVKEINAVHSRPLLFATVYECAIIEIWAILKKRFLTRCSTFNLCYNSIIFDIVFFDSYTFVAVLRKGIFKKFELRRPINLR